MPLESINPALQLFASGMMLLSIFAGLNIIRMRNRGCVLPYEPRRLVPWGAVGSFLALVFLFLKVAETLFPAGNSLAHETGSAHESISLNNYAIAVGSQCAMVIAFLAAVAYAYKANMRDLGIASTSGERVRDLCIGAAACLAALAPVHFVQILLFAIFFPEQKQSGHDLVKMVLAQPDGKIFTMAAIAAVIVAPVCEEIVFRLLFQGWLERWEDERLGWRRAALEQTAVNCDATTEPVEPVPPSRGVFALAYGWFPILISATVFGLVHYGYGPEPVPLFLLGLVLGYLYQRTHRLLPSIVAHALFNLFTIIILWQTIHFRG